MRTYLLVLIACLGLIGAPYAFAETDYPCFDNCVRDGKNPAATCLARCTKEEPPHSRPLPTATDYRCLELCTQNGKSASACLSQCRYDLKPSANTPPPAKGALSTHEVLDAPVPIDRVILPPHESAEATELDKNYACVMQCLHDGMQNALCNQKCMDVTPEMQLKGQ